VAEAATALSDSVAIGTRGYRRAAVRICLSGRAVQLASAAAAIVVAILLVAASAWPFDASGPKLPARPIALAAFALRPRHAWIRPAGARHVGCLRRRERSRPRRGGRWLKSFGAGGLIADDAAGLRGMLEATERELDRTTRGLEERLEERKENNALRIEQLRLYRRRLLRYC
jgi:hypothetical protein